ncbi:MAG: hypothetical protein AAB250_06790, partial [Bdellovibrionota bacterium]
MTGQFLAVSGSSLTPGIAFSYDPDTGIYNAGANSLSFATTGLERMTIDGSGNIGVGTSAPSMKFDVVGDLKSSNSYTTNAYLARTFGENNAAASPTYSFTYSGNMGMYALGADTLAFSTASTSRLVIDPNGNVGIGTSTPGETLHVVGVGKIERIINDSAPTEFILKRRRNTSPPTSGSEFGAYEFAYPDTNGIERVVAKVSAHVDGTVGSTDQPSALSFTTSLDGGVGLSERMRIANTGNVGIGTTSPSNKLEVVGGAIAAGSIGSGTGNGGQVRFYDLGSSGSNFVAFRAPDSIANDVVWSLPATDGTVGQMLGTNGAGSLSWTTASTSGGDFLRDGSLSMTGQLQAINGSSLVPSYTFANDSDTGLFNPIANTLAISTAGQQRLTVDSSGLVGIGTTSPIDRLHIVIPDSDKGIMLQNQSSGVGMTLSPAWPMIKFNSYYDG